jgi:hypothetical protein
MANFLITNPNTVTQGTVKADTVVIQTAGLLGSTVFGSDGNDLVSAAGGGNGVNTKLNAGLGNDTINLQTGLGLNVGAVFAGGGDDLITAVSATFAGNTIINGGGGADTINLGAATTVSATTVNGNGGKDLISAQSVIANNAFIGLGGGADVFNITTGTFSTSTIALGGGADRLSAVTLSGGANLRIEGDTVGDSEWYGNDSIRVVAGQLGQSALLQAGGGADSITLSAGFLTGTTINGNAGHDVINVETAATQSAGFLIGGGAGKDTITISGALATGNGTIFGGGGDDIITVSAVQTGAATQLVGGTGADTFQLGATVSAGQTSVNIRYTSFSESTLGSVDYVSATVTRGSAFIISNSVVSGSTAVSVNAGGADGIGTDAGGIVTGFGANVGTDVTARTIAIDTYLSQGQVAAFTDGAGNDYLFIQGGAAGSGTADDLLVQTNSLVTGFAIVGGSAVLIDL